MARFYPGLVGILVAFVGWVAMMVASKSMLVGTLVGVVDVIGLDARQGIMGKCVCWLRHE